MYLPNCIRLISYSPLHVRYAYVDAEGYLADALLAERKVRIRFGEEVGEGGSPYRVIFCKVRKADEASFLDAMHRLQNKMLLMGHPDYMDYCAGLIARLEHPQDWRIAQEPHSE